MVRALSPPFPYRRRSSCLDFAPPRTATRTRCCLHLGSAPFSPGGSFPPPLTLLISQVKGTRRFATTHHPLSGVVLPVFTPTGNAGLAAWVRFRGSATRLMIQSPLARDSLSLLPPFWFFSLFHWPFPCQKRHRSFSSRPVVSLPRFHVFWLGETKPSFFPTAG